MCLFFTFRQTKTQISGNEQKFKKQLLNKTRLLSNLLYKKTKWFILLLLCKKKSHKHKKMQTKLDCSTEGETNQHSHTETMQPGRARKFFIHSNVYFRHNYKALQFREENNHSVHSKTIESVPERSSITNSAHTTTTNLVVFFCLTQNNCDTCDVKFARL